MGRSVRATSPTAARTSPDGAPSCDGDGLLGAFRAAVANLEAHVDEINALNVYPVPDGDTGSNMVATVKAALEEAEGRPAADAGRVAAAISFGALMGARGNSGVITSQIFRGMAEGLGGKSRFNGLDLAHALSEGARTAYGAVAKPVEGTILTVIRESADAAVVAAERDNDIETVLAATLAAAEKSVARTPSLLAILREAGVVDAGGQGLYRLFQGALLHLVGRSPASAARDRSAAGAGVKPSILVAHADEGFGYETMFLLQPNGSGGLDVDAIRDHLESIGESVLVAGDSRALKIHVHNERPDLVVGYGLSVGALSRISVENLDNQARDVRETRAAAFTGDAPDPAASRIRARPPSTAGRPADDDAGARRSVAVAAGDGLAAIFRDFGVAVGRPGRPVGQPEHRRAARGRPRRRCARGHRPAEQPERRPRRAAGRVDGGAPGRRRPDPQRGRGLRGAPGARPDPRRGRQRRPDDRGRPVDPDGRRHRGGPRRDDRRAQGQARPDDRPRSGRRAGGGRRRPGQGGPRRGRGP